MKQFSHLNTAVEVLNRYDGAVPFHHFLREFFRLDKKYGSRDRKNISRLCYAALRLGRSFTHLSLENRIRAGLFLCSTASDETTRVLLGDWDALMERSFADKWELLAKQFPAKEAESQSYLAGIFPLAKDHLSTGIEPTAFFESFLLQPALFLRIRPGKQEQVKSTLQGLNHPFSETASGVIALPPTIKLDEFFEADKDIVVQDYSSQRTIELLTDMNGEIKKVWDCCAASGGKSILAWDTLPDIDLTVTDKRGSILANLEKRFSVAGIERYEAFVSDLSSPGCRLPKDNFDLIIADLPCSGSGTWSRTPEQLVFFNPAILAEFQVLQQRILMTVVKKMKPGGYLWFITCSVLSRENEENIQFMQDQLKLRLIRSETIKGYQQRADTMFAALLQA